MSYCHVAECAIVSVQCAWVVPVTVGVKQVLAAICHRDVFSGMFLLNLDVFGKKISLRGHSLYVHAGVCILILLCFFIYCQIVECAKYTCQVAVVLHELVSVM